MTEISRKDYEESGLGEYIEDLENQTVLGSGGFGSVIEASFRGRQVAAKVSSGKGVILQKQFENEKKSAHFKHENLLRLLYYGENSRSYYLLYERMPKTLIDVIMDLNWDGILKIIMGIAQGIKYLHDNEYVHGDIKPQKVLLTYENKPKLGDFGGMIKIGASSSGSVTSQGYLARSDLKNVGNPSKDDDIFAFGITTIQLIMKETEVKKRQEGRRSNAELLTLDKFLRGYKQKVVHRSLKRDDVKAERTMALAERCTQPLGRPPIQDVCDELSRI